MVYRSPRERRRRRRTTRLLAGLLAILAGLTGYVWFLGYLGGPTYKLVPATARGDGTVALFLSGDMGFNTGMGPPIAARLAAHGIPVLGVNSLTAFRHRLTPDETAALVRDGATRALALPGARRVVLIGQSFGANALLVGAPALPPAIRARTAMVELIVPAETVLLRATPGGVLDIGHDGPALPDARRLDWTRVLCIHGATEAGSLCPDWRQPNVRAVALPGDHFLRRDPDAVADALIAALPARR